MGNATQEPTVNGLSENLARTTLKEAQTAAPSASAALPNRNTAVEGTFEDTQATYKGPRLSKRGQSNPTQEMGEKLDLIFRNTYDKDSNPDGLINLGLAENTLLTAEYLDFFKGALDLQPWDLTYGTQTSGSRRLHAAIAKMWNENFAPLQPVRPDDIVTGPGATGVLDQLVACLLDAGEGVLLAGPHYNGFDVNMVARSGARILPAPIPLADVFTPREVDVHLEAALKAATEEGTTVRAVMLCSPHNPYGRTYDRATLAAYALFCERHDLHLISDEIYALSVFDNPNIPDAPPFISMLSLDVEQETGQPFDRSRLHIVYSFSKDFGINGFRIGAIISPHNPFLLRCLMQAAFLMKVSSPADCLVSALINDDAAFKRLVAENQRRLGASAAFMRAWFEARGMRPQQSNAGHFMLVDVRERLGIRTFEDEKQIALKSVPAGVLVGMGGTYHHPEPGWLRVTFSLDRPTLELALQRLAQALDL